MCGDAGAKEVDDIKLTATSVFATNGDELRAATAVLSWQQN